MVYYCNLISSSKCFVLVLLSPKCNYKRFTPCTHTQKKEKKKNSTMSSPLVTEISTLELSIVVILVVISMTSFILLREIVEPLCNVLLQPTLSGTGKQYRVLVVAGPRL
jgi:hypothetical protein